MRVGSWAGETDCKGPMVYKPLPPQLLNVRLRGRVFVQVVLLPSRAARRLVCTRCVFRAEIYGRRCEARWSAQ